MRIVMAKHGLMLFLCFLLKCSVVSSQECDSKGACLTGTVNYPHAMHGAVFGEASDLFMLQVSSRGKHAITTNASTNATTNATEVGDPWEWQCHLYTPGQTDAWCMAATIEGGYEYSFTSGKYDQCGGCFCCKRAIPEVQQEKLLGAAKELALTAEVATEGHAPTWACHAYTPGQTDDWCRTTGIENGFSYYYNAGKYNQCDGCHCCKRAIPKQVLMKIVAEAEEFEREMETGAMADAAMEPGSWQCHLYAPGQNDTWCMTTTVEGGFEYQYNGGVFDQCDGCHCCRREAAHPMSAEFVEQVQAEFVEQAETSAREVERYEQELRRDPQSNYFPPPLLTTKSKAWHCHRYVGEQNDAWCLTATIDGGYEYSFTNGLFKQCGDCLCCRRQVPEAQRAALLTAAHGLMLTAVAHTPTWSCHLYDKGELEGQGDAWCMEATIEDGVSYSYNGGKYDQCGGCYCCKREIPKSSLVKLLAHSQALTGAGTMQRNENEAQLQDASVAKVQAQSEKKEKGWQCHSYTAGQTDSWCSTVAIEDGYQFSYNGGQLDQCGGCWCCKRQIPKSQRAQLLMVSKELHLAEENSEEPIAEWQCHTYAQGQNDDWCSTTAVEGGFEYMYNGGKINQCGGCYCCKREIRKGRLASA